MNALVRRIAAWVAPAVAIVYLVSWICSEFSRANLAANTAVFALFALAIGLSEWMPLTSLGLVLAVLVMQCIGIAAAPQGTTWPTYGAIAIVAFFIGMRGVGLARYSPLPVGLIAAGLIAWRIVTPVAPNVTGNEWFYFEHGSTRLPFAVLTLAAFGTFAAAWAIGFALSASRRLRIVSGRLIDTESRWQQADLELRLTQDRANIARDVHDALAHSLAIIVSQAQGALALSRQKPAVAAESLENIESVGRGALIEVRTLVERIRLDDDSVAPRATLENIPELVAHIRQVGVDALLESFGKPQPLTASQQLAVYRIVQESLTNALKHGGHACTASVTLAWRDEDLSLTVTSHGTREADENGRDVPPVTASPGIGIQGMKERARLAGGWLTAEQQSDAFIITALIPGHASGRTFTQSAEEMAGV